MRFSVLIPVYNVEKYLDQCLKSVLTQDFMDFEVILVNDGSTDQSPYICRNYAETDSRIKYYNKKNEGLLLTRRFSIKQASGEYIVFLDSDDFWEPGILSKLNDEIESSHADMICYRFKRVTDDGVYLNKDVGVFPDKTLFSKENKDQFLIEFVRSTRLNNIWLKCVRNSIVDKETDYKPFGDKKGEDILQSITLIKKADSILYLDDALVNYRESKTGRSRNFKLKYVYDFNAVKNHVYNNLIEMKASDTVIKEFYRRYIESLIGYLGLVAVYSKSLSCFIEECKHIEDFQLYKKLREVVVSDDIDKSCRNDYNNFRKHRYSIIYGLYTTKDRIRRQLSHIFRGKL